MKKNLILLVLSIILILKSNYSFSIEPDIFIQSTVNRAAQTLSSNLTKDERVKELKDIAIQTFIYMLVIALTARILVQNL